MYNKNFVVFTAKPKNKFLFVYLLLVLKHLPRNVDVLSEIKYTTSIAYYLKKKEKRKKHMNNTLRGIMDS